jgi:hypothetical protein
LGFGGPVVTERGDADNPFVYAFSRRLLSFPIILTSSGAVFTRRAGREILNFFTLAIKAVRFMPNLAAGDRNWPRLRLVPMHPTPYLAEKGSRQMPCRCFNAALSKC